MYIDFIVPELYESDGGIQNYSKTLIYSVRALLPNAILRVFVLNDGHNHDSAIGQAGITYFNAARSKPRFVSSLFKAARLNFPSLVISTHSWIIFFHPVFRLPCCSGKRPQDAHPVAHD
jgi:hypothetical protein